MPKYELRVKLEQENLKRVYISDASEYTWKLKCRCDNCRDETENYLFAQASESAQVDGGPGEANAVWKCRGCRRLCTINVLADTVKELDLSKENAFLPLVQFEVRGAEPVAWQATSEGLLAESSGGKDDLDVELDNGEWTDYDDDNDMSVSIFKIESEFARVK